MDSTGVKVMFSVTILLVFGCCWGQSSADTVFVFQDPVTCPKNRSFSATHLACAKCHWDTAQPETSNSRTNFGVTDCPCPRGFWERRTEEASPLLVAGRKIVRTSCVPCTNGTVSADRKVCVPCTESNPYDIQDGGCKLCSNGSVSVMREEDGSPRSQLECIQCADGYTPSPTKEHCVPCHPSFPNPTAGVCLCPLTHRLVNGICFPNSVYLNSPVEQRNLHRLKYDDGITVDSTFFKENLPSSYFLCKNENNETACQLLANMCVLQLHSSGEDLSEVCKLYQNVEATTVGVGTGKPLSNLPKLDYPDHLALLQKPNLITHEFTSDLRSPDSNVNISVARFSSVGKFLGLTSLTEVIPCIEKIEAQRTSQKLGATTRLKCSIPIQEMWKRYSAQMEFLDPYLSHYHKSGQDHTLYSIPIKIMNMKREGVKVNENSEEKYQWKLVRRFFVLDTIGGFDNPAEKGDGAQKIPKSIRYVEKMHVGIQLQPGENPGRIFIPMITLTYNQINAVEYVQNKPIEFKFEVEYYMDMTRSIEDVKISVGVISALAVIWAAFQTWSWNRRNGRVEVDIETIFNLLVISCGHIADAFFIVCFSTTLYWFVFFKKQVAVHVFLPQYDQERLIRDLLISAFVLKVVDMIKLIGRQVSVDIFFVDWEKPRARSVIQPPSEGKIRNGDSNIANGNNEKSDNSVSIWRTYFVANEWNEIQATRKIHFALQIIISLFFLEIVGFKYLGLYWPDCSLSPGKEAENIPYSTSARFTIGSLVFGTIGIIQWLYRIGFYDRYMSNKIQDFVDVCTLANISVFILAGKQHGYYIHGRSVHGFADTDMQTMIDQLNREEEDMCGRRGLLPSTDQQTFLISVPHSLRLVYSQVLQPLFISSNLAAAHGRQQFNALASSKSAPGSKPTSAQLSSSVQAYHSMNRFLTAFLEHALSDMDYDVTKKSFFESTFDMEFGEVGNDRAVFYTDNGHSFDSVLFYGNERTIFMFNLYLFIFVDLLSHDFVLAGVVTFLADMALKYIRNVLGKRNIAQKTLIDGRFLI